VSPCVAALAATLLLPLHLKLLLPWALHSLAAGTPLEGQVHHPAVLSQVPYCGHLPASPLCCLPLLLLLLYPSQLHSGCCYEAQHYLE